MYKILVKQHLNWSNSCPLQFRIVHLTVPTFYSTVSHGNVCHLYFPSLYASSLTSSYISLSLFVVLDFTTSVAPTLQPSLLVDFCLSNVYQLSHDAVLKYSLVQNSIYFSESIFSNATFLTALNIFCNFL